MHDIRSDFLMTIHTTESSLSIIITHRSSILLYLTLLKTLKIMNGFVFACVVCVQSLRAMRSRFYHQHANSDGETHARTVQLFFNVMASLNALTSLFAWHCVIYGVESWNGVVEWSGVWSGVEL